MDDERPRPHGPAGSSSAAAESGPQQLVLWSAARETNDEPAKRRPRRELTQGAASKFLLIEPIVAHAAPPRDREIRVDDAIRPPRRDEFAAAEPPESAHWIQLALLGGALAVGLCLGWIGGFVSSRFFAPASVAAPVPHVELSPCTREGGCAAAKSDREASPRAAGPRARIVERSRDSARSTREANAAANRDVATTSSISSMQERTKIAPSRITAMPETRPTTIEGWTIREVTGNTVVLEGPGGVWRVTPGETVPGVGRIDSIVRWGSRWIVATTRGLISTLD